MGGDAVTFEKKEEGVTYLFVRPGQSFEYAVKNVLQAIEGMTLRRAQALVRDHCPSIIDMNERLGTDQVVPRFEAAPDAGVVPAVPMKETGQHRRPRPPRWAKVAAVAAPALAGGMLIAQWLNPDAKSVANGEGTSISQGDKAAAHTFRDPAFQKIAEGGRMKCDPVGAYEAKCVDADGQVMYSEASVGTSTAFTFSYDREKIGFRLFPDVESAEAWAAEEANQNLYQNVKLYGRVVLWGTDDGRLNEWGDTLSQQTAQPGAPGGPGMMSMTAVSNPFAALPDRLAFLAFGTLGVTQEAIHQAVLSSDSNSEQLLRAVELVLGGAGRSMLGLVPSGAADAVAIVADAPSSTGSATEVHTATDPVPAPPPATNEETALPPAPERTPKAPTESSPPTDPVQPAPIESVPVEPTLPPKGSAPGPAPVPTPAPEPEPDAVVPEPVPVVPERPEAPQPLPEPPVEARPPETVPAPPVEEEPEDDGLGMDTLPVEWAA
ncbi:hypothetical protein [Streptomyces sp. NPDC088707]|uniref:hypothetical protein n=1 Tax=Streptomyces sp. NPDC088707 TaxID=3365871 RepID=UPI00381966AA